MRLRFLAVVFFISSCVIFYRDEYMSREKIKNSFAFVVFLFVASMIFLIIRPNFLRVILGWDGLGLVSFLLVIYYSNFKSYGAGIITCLRNRIGDGAILIAIGWILAQGDLTFIFYKTGGREILAVAGFVILAAMTKRAQAPFSAWLPAAMAAPTPVSALVHSSTLVTAGVYLLIRFYPVIASVWARQILFFLRALTMAMSRIGALYETDLKKIIALSTLSQLGLMIISLRAGYCLLAFFHLLTHALFKACLFLCAGRVIHIYGGRQDVRGIRVVGELMP
jgi:NADH-ubiquinone oxidoreductase chain 5